MRKLSKKISMLMVLAMLVGLFSGVVSASAASAWSFASSKYDVAVNGSINMESKEYADFDLLKDGKAPAGYTVAWASSDEDVVWVNAKTGQLRANKFGKAADGDKAVISATFTNTATKKSATRSFTIVLGAAKADFTVEADDVTIALGEEVKFAPVVKNADGKVVKFATHKSYNGYFLDGKAIANPWTPEEAGEYTVTVAQFAKKANVADLAKAVRKTEVKVTVTVDDFSAEATGVKEITVYGDFAKDAKFSVKKGTGISVSFEAAVAEDGKSAKLALKNRLTKGVYTIACGDASVSIDCEDEKPVKVIIEEKDGVVATNPERTEAYAHYDVLNQYGESIRKTTNVQVTSSTNVAPTYNRATGRVVMATTGDATFIYGSQIVLNIAATGYSAFESAIMTAGLEDSVDAVKIAGITLADSGKILDEAPVSFLGAQGVGTAKFYLLFQRLDRAGYVMATPTTPADLATAKDELFFASLNPMLVKEFGNTLEVKRIDGVDYLAVEIVAGMQLKKGGVAPIEIRSNKTGGATEYELRVVSDQILNQFTILPYEDIIVKNRTTDDWPGIATSIDLKYEALDTNGEAITDFRALYDRVYFSDANVKFYEDWDGSAKLTYTVPQNANINPTKDFDVPVVINAIVPEGSGNTVTLYIKEARYVETIDGYVGNNTILEGQTLTINLGSNNGNDANRVQVADQYDDVLKELALYFSGTASNKRAEYFGVKLTGNTGLTLGGTNLGTLSAADGAYTVYAHTADVTLTAAAEVTDKTEQYTVEFVLLDANKKPLSATAKAYTFYVADISQATNFTLGTQYGADKLIENNDASVGKANDNITFQVTANFPTGGSAVLDNAAVAGTSKYVVEYATEAKVYTNTSKTAMVSATGSSATISASYYDGNDVGPLQLASQFNNAAALNPDGTYASRNVPISVTVTVKIGSLSGSSYANYQLRDTLKDTVEVGNHWRGYNTIVLESWFTGGIQATDGVLTHGDFVGKINMFIDTYNDAVGSWADAERTALRNRTKVTISNLKENLETGLQYGNLKLVNNVTGTRLEGVEVGDTFTATYEIDAAKVVVECTVGPDNNAYIKGNRDADDVIWY